MKREYIVAIYTAEVIVAILVATQTLNSACERFGMVNVIEFLATVITIVLVILVIWAIVDLFVD